MLKYNNGAFEITANFKKNRKPYGTNIFRDIKMTLFIIKMV